MTEKALEPKDLFPQGAKFYLSKMGKEYELRPLCAADWAWMTQSVPDIEKRLKSGDVDFGPLMKLIFRLILDEQKEDFAAVDKTVWTDDGEKETVRITGPQRLAESIKFGELPAITNAFKAAMNLTAVESGSAAGGDKGKKKVKK